MKKKLLIIVPIVLAVLAVCGWIGYNIYRHPGNARNHSAQALGMAESEAVRQTVLSRESNRILVAYFSHTGTTKGVATEIASRTGADLFEIRPEKAYGNVYAESNREIRKNERPALSGAVDDMSAYDVVFVGFPIWWHATPAPINTFLESYDLTGKLIIPFCTSSESPMEEGLTVIRN